ncbi:MAG: NAD-dependent epimerase/dehydratase family protein [Planctomycetota bacterium]
MSTSPSRQRVSLVTGGAGFIGSHLVELLARRGDRVVVVDDLSTGRRENLRHVDPAALTFEHTKVSEAVAAFTPGAFDEIYHLAAAVGVRLVVEDPIHSIETNVTETSAILRYAAAASTPLLVASTSEVYGKSTKTPFSETDDVVYGPTIYSRWSYACSKAIDEYLALGYARDHGLPAVIGRFFNTVGPRQVGEYGMVLPRFVAAAIAGEPLQVYGDGRQSRCFCDVRDVVPVLPRLLAAPACAGEILNIGRDDPIEIGALAALVRDTLGSDSPIEQVPYAEAYGRPFDDLRVRQPDLTKIRAAIGFEPRIPLERTIRDLAEEIRGHASPPVESTTP